MEWGVCPWLRRLGIFNDCTMSFGFCIGWMHRVLYFRFGLPIIDYLVLRRLVNVVNCYPLPYHLRTSITCSVVTLLYEQTIDSLIHDPRKSYCLLIGI